MDAACLAFLFPGQGSQYVGMGQAAAEAFPEARAAFDEADEALGFALSNLCFAGDEKDLRRTENTQPAILTVSVALHRVLRARGIDGALMAGHSLGEYSALVAADSLDLGTAVRLVRNRGRYMQEAVPDGSGAMAALLGLDDDVVVALCSEIAAKGAGTVQAANFNSPGQVVIAGDPGAVSAAMEEAKERGARRAVMLNVSAPFHCALMQPARQRLRADLASVQFHDPRVPVMCNVDGTELTRAEQIAPALERQVTAPVRWVDDLRAMVAAGADGFVEVGPGKVLGGLTKRTLKPVNVVSIQQPQDLDALQAMLELLGAEWSQEN